jgi:hypothetical protein
LEAKDYRKPLGNEIAEGHIIEGEEKDGDIFLPRTKQRSGREHPKNHGTGYQSAFGHALNDIASRSTERA